VNTWRRLRVEVLWSRIQKVGFRQLVVLMIVDSVRLGSVCGGGGGGLRSFHHNSTCALLPKPPRFLPMETVHFHIFRQWPHHTGWKAVLCQIFWKQRSPGGGSVLYWSFHGFLDRRTCPEDSSPGDLARDSCGRPTTSSEAVGMGRTTYTRTRTNTPHSNAPHKATSVKFLILFNPLPSTRLCSSLHTRIRSPGNRHLA
jgi:hypothetical protein